MSSQQPYPLRFSMNLHFKIHRDGSNPDLSVGGSNEDYMNTTVQQTPAEMYLSELPRSNHQKAIAVFETVASLQGFSDWRLAQWERITADNLPVMLEHFRAKYTDQNDTRFAIAMIKGVARCAWRQKLISGQQLAVIGKWKSE